MRVLKTWVVAAVLLAALAAGWSGFGNGSLEPIASVPIHGLRADFSLAPVLAATPSSGRGYTTGTTPLKKDAGGTAVGTLTPGTPVTITETRGSDAHVSVEGYSSAGSNAVVSAIGQRIVLVNLTAPDQAQRQAGAQTKDSYGTVWTQVTVSGWVAAGALTQDVQSVWTRAGQVYASHCSTCHSLYAPDQYTANQWPGNLQNMASNGGLSGEDFALVLKYLQTHAKPQ